MTTRQFRKALEHAGIRLKIAQILQAEFTCGSNAIGHWIRRSPLQDYLCHRMGVARHYHIQRIIAEALFIAGAREGTLAKNYPVYRHIIDKNKNVEKYCEEESKQPKPTTAISGLARPRAGQSKQKR